MMEISFRGQKVRINVFKESQYLDQNKECNHVEIMDELIGDGLTLSDDPLEEINVLHDSPQFLSRLKIEMNMLSFENPPQLEPKPLPTFSINFNYMEEFFNDAYEIFKIYKSKIKKFEKKYFKKISQN